MPIHNDQSDEQAPPRAASACAHYFLDPLSWMRQELEQGKLDGRFECPKCRTNVGKYAWQGMQCSCGDWIVPGISLAKGRVDEVRARHSGVPGASGAADAAAAIRRPPPPPPTSGISPASPAIGAPAGAGPRSGNL